MAAVLSPGWLKPPSASGVCCCAAAVVAAALALAPAGPAWPA
eukprot:CAMPEP_0197489238 /NCGR_PEP_ID=MMETSP1311-20131121/4078_1 /TAXON_ID=464262 /ORGANISM="Genus nov. species nov., Strain RCC856" /LENGTH=41 /DNA_ID= /DNA_START= /DNA_END= /DNA_ORIENTATION=